MIQLYSEQQFIDSKSTDKLPCKCYECGNSFYKLKKRIKYEITHKKGDIRYCSNQCLANSKKKEKSLNCTQCKIQFNKKLSDIKKSKNHFCSRSCSTTYNNKHKKFGTRRSKLEIWLEEQLTLLYPNLDIHFNRKDTIGSELDIYIPSLNLAIELNGIFHYEPIYGNDKLHKIQENDISKSKACHDLKIDLCIIDTSGQTYVKPKTSQKYLNIIINIFKERLLV